MSTSLPLPKFVAQVMKYFGRKPEQSISEFTAEMRSLTPADRTELAGLLEKEGFPCDPASINPAPKV